jgi:hypothetical protein
MSSHRHIDAHEPAFPDRDVLSWWRLLCVLAAANVCAWLALWAWGPAADGGLQLALSGVYVGVCAYRSVLPRVDLERLVLVDTRLSSILLGRAAATVAEICFGLQLGLLVHLLGERAGLPVVQQAAWAIPAFMTVAQLFCWHSVLTLNHLTQAVESMLWAAGFAWMAALLALVAVEAQGGLRSLALLGIAGSLAFVAYALTVDVPMYWRRYRQGRARGQAYLRWHHGARDAWQRRVPDRRWSAWKADALWLTPYFSVGAWVSLAIVCVPVG